MKMATSNASTSSRGLEERLQEAVSKLGVPPSKYAEAQTSYDAVGEWLNDEASSLARFKPEIYPQGSFALGTAVRPIGDGHYDVDAVCLLHADRTSMSQAELKAIVGDRLKEHGKYAKMLDPSEGGRRCWTLQYADESKFHLDILPAIPDDPAGIMAAGVPPDYAQHAVCITDSETQGQAAGWPKSNPRGYALWFRSRMLVVLSERRRATAKRINASVEHVPDSQVTTPLQQAIQVLKRHRDVRYPDDDDRPISIIITTLAAGAYKNERSLIETLLSIIPNMRSAIERRSDGWWVPNPVNPEENFADRWTAAPRKAQLFFDWLDAVEREHVDLLSAGASQVVNYIKASYQVPLGADGIALVERRQLAPRTSHVAIKAGFSLDVPHRQTPPWTMRPQGAVSLVGHYQENGGWSRLDSSAAPLAKGLSLRFTATTDIAGPVEVFWQVVNTGGEARRVGGLRGEIFPSDSDEGNHLIRNESTSYSGSHWLECFIVQRGVCVARSGEYIVNIA